MQLEGNDQLHFQFFAEQVRETTQEFIRLNKEDFVKKQAELVNGLYELEVEFKHLLKKYNKEEEAFECFYNYITKEKRNLLAVRPFFRERSEVFVNGLIDYIRAKNYSKVFDYSVNYLFVKLICERCDFKQAKFKQIVNKIEKIRSSLVLMNIPLVISRARIFFSRNNRSHLSFMEMIQIGVGGLMSAIDKYCGAYDRVWKSVALGRLHGDLIGNTSDTFLHFYPEDRKRLYRANKFFAKNDKEDFNEKELLKMVNENVPKNDWATVDDIRELLLAVGTISADTRPHVADDERICDGNVVKMAAPEETRPDVRVELKEGLNAMESYYGYLTVFQRKLLKLKGLDIELI